MKKLFMQDIAEAAGIGIATVRSHRHTGNAARARGTDTPNDFPAPAGLDGIRPYWTPAQVEAWVAARKTPGKPGGITKAAMRDVLSAAQAGNVDRVITIAKEALK